MLTAFTLIQTDPNKTSGVAQTVANLPNVAEVYSVTGEYDIIAIIRLPEYDDLDRAIPEGIGKIDGVRRTNTVIAFRRFGAKDMAWDVGVE